MDDLDWIAFTLLSVCVFLMPERRYIKVYELIQLSSIVILVVLIMFAR